jgi:hypothetical protein
MRFRSQFFLRYVSIVFEGGGDGRGFGGFIFLAMQGPPSHGFTDKKRQKRYRAEKRQKKTGRRRGL